MAVATATKPKISKKPAPWTQAQIDLLIENVEKGPSNAEAFRNTAKALKKNPAAVSQKFYDLQKAKAKKTPKAAPSSKAKPVTAPVAKVAAAPQMVTKEVSVGAARQIFIRALDREIKTLDNKLAGLEAEREALVG